MDPQFWLERWDNNQIGFHQDEINTHLQRFWPQLGLAPDSHVFVPLAGKTLDLLWLAAQGHRVTGVEISERAVRAFFDENDLTPQVRDTDGFRLWQAGEITLMEGDYFDLMPEELGPLDAVFDRASLIALPPAMRPGYARQLQRLAPACPVLLVTLDYDQDEMDGPPFAVSAGEVEQLYAASHRISPLDVLDVLAENARFRERGLTRLEERVYRLAPLA
ncbi:thiopurine S-methyltransferase [Thiohalobacter sp. COW1]|uniref:thiopurine S-methyltransferase n=1 Tax=Thiohalobacter sp. COW1 TaxID=2795687 RepID=UPI001915A10A|nr:thiopurine S-methyltransferase [Thiohalobacter sp. COW1]BCO30771.1 thiopurine S-methyltransferase [Thiohalobacter sp. COW1]